MSSTTADLAALLSTVNRPGDFFASGKIEVFAPRLEVEGVGPIALPLLSVQAGQLVATAQAAPYGRADETVLDTNVRRTWQIGAERVRIGGKHWPQTLEKILARVGEGLGVAEPIAAELYKLLIYDQGSFFVSHRDTEKSPGMFATLVIVLPSISAGGELIIRHKGREVRLDLRCEEPSELAYAAFYADCVHEVLPITAGFRLTLVYNLVRRGKGPAPQPPSYDREHAKAAALLKAWVAGKRSPDDEAPEKIVYPLEHAYTPAELGFAALKGGDAAVAGVLAAAAPQADCDLHLALASIEESGAAEYTAYYGSRPGRWSEPEDEFEAGEVFDRHESLSEWRRRDGTSLSLGALPIEDGELSPPDAFDNIEPDEQHFHEATGNEGASFDRTYRRAALVLWPREQFSAVLNQAGLPVTLAVLEDMAERWAASGEEPASPLWSQAHELSACMLATWPMDEWRSRDGAEPSEAGRMLAALTRLEDTERIEAFLSDIVAPGLFDLSDNAAILGALDLLQPNRAADLLERIVKGTAAASFGSCANLLARAVAAATQDSRTRLAGALVALVAALPGDPGRDKPLDPWVRGPRMQARFVVDLFNAAAPIDAALARRAADHMLAWPKTYHLDRALVPAVRDLLGSAAAKDSAAVQQLRAACLDHLRKRIAGPLTPPADWRRPSKLACTCAHCKELGGFLADPERKTWTLKAAEHARAHVADTIRNADCDLDMTTDRRGRPYSLVCTKNQASYDRRLKQRTDDLANLKRLGG